MYEDYDDYEDFLDDYNDQLNDLEDQEQFAYDMYESEVNGIDEYWDRENEYIKNSGIYTDEEVQQILANHEEIRKSKKKEAREWYEFERDTIHFDREQGEMAESDREIERLLEETVEPAPIYYQQPMPQYERPSLLKRAFAFAGAYYLFSKLFHSK
jgi:hypothetical protein